MIIDHVTRYGAFLAILAYIQPALGRDASLAKLSQVKLIASPSEGQGVTFKTIDSDEHVSGFNYAMIDPGAAGKKATVVPEQDYPFGVFFKNKAGQRVHTICHVKGNLAQYRVGADFFFKNGDAFLHPCKPAQNGISIECDQIKPKCD